MIGRRTCTLDKVKVTDNIDLSAIRTDRFKTGVITLTLSLPLSVHNYVYCSLLPGVLRRGTQKYPDIASLNRRLDELYASCVDIRCSRVGKNLNLIISAEMLDEAYVTDGAEIVDGVMEVIAQTLLSPKLEGDLFPAAIVEQEKRFSIDNVNASVNNTRLYASIRLGEIMFRGDSEYPTCSRIKELTSSIDNVSLTEYYRSLLASSPLDVFYVGSLPTERISDILRKHFSEWNSSGSCGHILPCAEPVLEFCSLTERMPVSQGKLALGFKVGVVASHDDDSYYAAILLNEIFGGSPASKLFLNVREGMSLCYYCSSSYNQYTGVITVSSGIENKNRDIAERAILEQLEDIRNGRISEVELIAAKTSLRNAYMQIYDNPYELQSFYGNRAIFGIRDDIESTVSKLFGVTLDGIISVARQTVYDSAFYVEGTADSDCEEVDDDEE